MITITAAEIDAEVSAWIAANQTGKRRPGIARIAKALGYARLSVKSSVERIERAAAKAAEPTTHRAYCRNTTIECSCTEYGRDHVARLETYDNPTPAPLDISATIREYIEAEYRGAALVMDDKCDEIMAALMAADPNLSHTAAAFRFHNLVAEMRGNGEISAETLARIAPAAEPTEASRSWGAAFAAVTARDAPQYVSVTDEQGGVWHLVDADENPVAAGEYTAKDGDRFTITATPEAYFGLSVNEAPRVVEIQWQTIAGRPRSKRQSGVFGAYVDMIVTGWHWVPIVF